jgi:hypothetical protein
VPTPAAGFDDFWVSIDLVGVPMTFDDGVYGNCAGMSIFGDVRGAEESLEDFIDSQDFAFGIHSAIGHLPTDIFTDWDWSIPGWFLPWKDLSGSSYPITAFAAAGAFSSSFTKWTPQDASVLLACDVVLDSTTWTIEHPTKGSSMRDPHEMRGTTEMPTAFYESAAVDSYGTGF